MQWKPYLMGFLLALVVGQVTLLVSQIGSCPVAPCQPFAYCTSEAGDSQMVPSCSYWDNQCPSPAEIRYQDTSPWCCDAFIDSTGITRIAPGCCQYVAEIFLCVNTGRWQIWMVNGQYLGGQMCNFYTGVCGYFA